jgi:hypothetical protein
VQFGGTAPQLAALVSLPPQTPHTSIPAVQRSVGVGVRDGTGESQISGVVVASGVTETSGVGVIVLPGPGGVFRGVLVATGPTGVNVGATELTGVGDWVTGTIGVAVNVGTLVAVLSIVGVREGVAVVVLLGVGVRLALGVLVAVLVAATVGVLVITLVGVAVGRQGL